MVSFCKQVIEVFVTAIFIIKQQEILT